MMWGRSRLAAFLVCVSGLVGVCLCALENDVGHFVPSGGLKNMLGGVAVGSSVYYAYLGLLKRVLVTETRPSVVRRAEDASYGKVAVINASITDQFSLFTGGKVIEGGEGSALFAKTPYALVSVVNHKILVYGLDSAFGSTETEYGEISNIGSSNVDATIVSLTANDSILVTLSAQCDVIFYTLAADTANNGAITATSFATNSGTSSSCHSIDIISIGNSLYALVIGQISSPVIKIGTLTTSAFTSTQTIALIGDDFARLKFIINGDKPGLLATSINPSQDASISWTPSIITPFEMTYDTSRGLKLTMGSNIPGEQSRPFSAGDVQLTTAECGVSYNLPDSSATRSQLYFSSSSSFSDTSFVVELSNVEAQRITITFTKDSANENGAFIIDRSQVNAVGSGGGSTTFSFEPKTAVAAALTLDIIVDHRFLSFSFADGESAGVIAYDLTVPFTSVCLQSVKGSTTALSQSVVTTMRNSSIDAAHHSLLPSITNAIALSVLISYIILTSSFYYIF